MTMTKANSGPNAHHLAPPPALPQHHVSFVVLTTMAP
jgi:hypothetical protein